MAPIAEWIAQPLWNSHRESLKAVQHLPTRLTHRRRIEGRGNDFEVKASAAPHRSKICGICAAEGVKNRYCRSCAVDASRGLVAQFTPPGYAMPKSSKTKALLSKVLSNHAVAYTWWEPSSLPSWLTEECFAQKIQPLLRAKKVREIAAAIQVSKLYAGLIRSGRRRPHPRHWQMLAKLVGVSGGGATES